MQHDIDRIISWLQYQVGTVDFTNMNFDNITSILIKLGIGIFVFLVLKSIIGAGEKI